MTVVNNFNVGTSSTNGDVLDFAIGAWSIFGATHGLVNGTMAIASATSGPAIVQQITPGVDGYCRRHTALGYHSGYSQRDPHERK